MIRVGAKAHESEALPLSAEILRKPLTTAEARLKNPLALAFVGDTVWDLLIRQRLLTGDAHAGALHAQAIRLANAGAQAKANEALRPCLTESEQDVLRRGENAHAKHAAPKNQTAMDYSRATGLEALFGYLYLSGQAERICELFDIAVAIL